MARLKKISQPLSLTNPDIVKEWDYDNNVPLTPDNVSYGSNRKVWWICSVCGHKWQAMINSRVRGTGCPVCGLSKGHLTKNAKNIKLKGSLAQNNPKLASEWNVERNYPLTPESVTISSGKKVWWKCNVCGNQWETKICNRTKGTGCPECGKKLAPINLRKAHLFNKGSLAVNNPELAKQWNYDKNAPITPNDVTAGLNKKVWWLCPTCGYDWQATIASRNSGVGCPICAKEKQADSYRKQHVSKIGSLAEINPELASEWHPSKNLLLTPNDVSCGSDAYVWWQCRKGHEWQAVISSRNSGRGCPICQSETHTSFPEQAVLFYLSKLFDVESRYKYMNKEIDVYIPEIATGVEYDGSFFHKPEKKKLKDKEKQDFFEACGITIFRIIEGKENSISGRNITFNAESSYKELPWAINSLLQLLKKDILDINLERDKVEIYEQYIVSEKNNSISTKYPEIALEWNFEKNGKVQPESIAYSSNKSFWWKCSQGHEWKAVVASRTVGKSGCPYCSGHIVISGVNDLATVNPELATEWAYDKNGDLLPSQVLCSSNKSVWWKGICGHEWQAVIFSRNRGNGCPYCSGQKILQGFNDLATTNPGLLLEWEYNKNANISPEMISANSHKKAWWKCQKCGHEWLAQIKSRNNGVGCPECKGKKIAASRVKTEIKKSGSLGETNHILSLEWNYEKNYPLTPYDVVAGSHNKAWWRCSKCGYEWEAEIRSRNLGCGCSRCKGLSHLPIKCIETGKIYTSFREAASDIGIKQTDISRCCKGIRKTAGGYHWEFVS